MKQHESTPYRANELCLIVSIGHASCTCHNMRVGLVFEKKHTVFRVIIKVTEKLVIIR